jgi:hypothetical protein
MSDHAHTLRRLSVAIGADRRLSSRLSLRLALRTGAHAQLAVRQDSRVNKTRLVLTVSAFAGWVALGAAYYLSLPIYGALGVLSWLIIIGGCWVWASVASAVAVFTLIQDRAFGRAIVVAVLAVVAAAGILRTDWFTAYLESQFWLHRDRLSALAAEYEAGTLSEQRELPWQIRYLSIDGRAHLRNDSRALYIPMFQNWRGEAGGGLVYLSEPPNSETIIATAPGGMGVPHRYIGDGWWWVGGG